MVISSFIYLELEQLSLKKCSQFLWKYLISVKIEKWLNLEYKQWDLGLFFWFCLDQVFGLEGQNSNLAYQE